MAGADDRNKGSIQFLVGQLGALFNQALMMEENPADLMHKAVNGMSVWAAPLVIDREKVEANARFFELWRAIPRRWEDMPLDTRPEEDDFSEYRRYKQMEAYACLLYDQGILTKQDVLVFDAERGGD